MAQLLAKLPGETRDNPQDFSRPRHIIEFAEKYLGFRLYVTQRAILKAFYSIWLTDEERELLETWKAQGKTNWEEGQQYRELVLVAGMRGGKTILAAIIGLWEADAAAALGNPAEYYGLAPGQKLFVVNVAKSEDQAKDTVFAAMEGFVENSPYYQQLIEAKKFVKKKENEYQYPDAKVILWSSHSNSGSLVGRTAKCVIFDELARFQDSKTGVYSGKMVYDSLGRAVMTLKEHGKKVSISSPLFEDDIIMSLYKKGMEGKLPGTLVFKLATWELNPTLTREDLEPDFVKDPETAQRDFGADPPATDNPYFQFPERIDKCVVENPPPCTVEQEITTRMIRDTGELKEYVSLRLSDLNFDPEQVYYAFGDAATESDSYALAIGHGIPILQELQDDQGNVVQRMMQKPIVDLILEWEPDKKHRRPVDVLNVTAVLEQLAKTIAFRKVMFDRFNAPHQIQRLIELGIDAESKQFSNDFQLKLYDTLKGLVYTYNIEITRHVNGVPSEKHINQLKHIRLTAGKKITHKELGKDLADVIAGLAWLISSAETTDDIHLVMPSLLSVTLKT